MNKVLRVAVNQKGLKIAVMRLRLMFTGVHNDP